MPEAIRSMTGAGSAAVDDPVLGRFEAETRSVNHRFLKTTTRVFGPLPPLEGPIEDAVRRRVQRGHVSVTVRFQPPPAAGASRVDDAAFGAAAARLRDLAARHGVAAPAVRDVLLVPGVIADGRSAEDAERVAAGAVRAVEGALEALEASRAREGGLLAAELLRLLDDVDGLAREAARRAAEAPPAARERLAARLRDLLAGTGVAVDPDTVVREAALLADRSDVQEELARLAAHVAHARQILGEGGAVGRRLDFLVQELHREANTLGSKSADLGLTRASLELKAHVERLREQVQNLE